MVLGPKKNTRKMWVPLHGPECCGDRSRARTGPMGSAGERARTPRSWGSWSVCNVWFIQHNWVILFGLWLWMVVRTLVLAWNKLIEYAVFRRVPGGNGKQSLLDQINEFATENHIYVCVQWAKQSRISGGEMPLSKDLINQMFSHTHLGWLNFIIAEKFAIQNTCGISIISIGRIARIFAII